MTTLVPRIFPRESTGIPFNAESIPIANSGVLVATPVINEPVTKKPILRLMK